MSTNPMTGCLELPAFETLQGKRKIYTFPVDGKTLGHFCTVSRIRRGEDLNLSGYQRPEIRKHIEGISNYLNSDTAILPNSIVVAFSENVIFHSKKEFGNGVSHGFLRIPLDEEEKPGWVVDGQQRMGALRECSRSSFFVIVNAFVTKDYNEQKEQFILVNSTKPLPRGLIHELLPHTNSTLPVHLERKKIPAHFVERLNRDEDSPFHGIICTATNLSGIVKDNSIMKMVENSISDGVLFRFRHDLEQSVSVVKTFWSAVKRAFPDSWGLQPRYSRLLHGAGVITLGYLMDTICDRFRPEIPSENQFLDEISKISSECRWREGYWNFGPRSERKWNELQNTSNDVQLLANYILTLYRFGGESK